MTRVFSTIQAYFKAVVSPVQRPIDKNYCGSQTASCKNLHPHSALVLTFISCLIVLPQKSQAEATAWVDMDIRDGNIFVSSSIAGFQGHSLIDTGAQFSGINTTMLTANDLQFRKSGKKLRVIGVFGEERRDYYSPIPVDIFGASLEFRDLVGMPLGPPEVQLIIGADWMSRLIFQFDYPNSRMRGITRDSLDLKALQNVESKRDTDGGSPIVKVRLNDERDVWLVLDTGNAGGVVMERSIALKEDWLDTFPVTQHIAGGVNSSGGMDEFRLPLLKIGPVEIENPAIRVPQKGVKMAMFAKDGNTSSRTKKSRGKSRGLLGYDVLQHFVVTIDYAKGYVHLAVPDPA